MIEQLCYVRLGTPMLDRAVAFAQDVLGLQCVGRSANHAAFRSDARDPSLVFVEGDTCYQILGFEVRDRATLHRAVDRLKTAGLDARLGELADASLRQCREIGFVTDRSGNRFELVVRPQHSGWRFFGARDAGIAGLENVALRSCSIEEDQALWIDLLGASVRDWVGDSVYLGIDAAHNRLSLHPAGGPGIIAVEFSVENIDLLMQNHYFLQRSQVKIVHGPGRRPASGQIFLTFEGPDGVLFSFVTEGERFDGAAPRRPRQFAQGRDSFDSWGSECRIPEYAGSGVRP